MQVGSHDQGMKMSQVFTDVPQGILWVFVDELLYFLKTDLFIVAVWLPGFNSAVEALNTLPQDILVEMVGKLIVIISAQIKVHHSSNACGIASNYVCFIFMKLW